MKLVIIKFRYQQDQQGSTAIVGDYSHEALQGAVGKEYDVYEKQDVARKIRFIWNLEMDGAYFPPNQPVNCLQGMIHERARLQKAGKDVSKIDPLARVKKHQRFIVTLLRTLGDEPAPGRYVEEDGQLVKSQIASESEDGNFDHIEF
jgi:hypothetical protein